MLAAEGHGSGVYHRRPKRVFGKLRVVLSSFDTLEGLGLGLLGSGP